MAELARAGFAERLGAAAPGEGVRVLEPAAQVYVTGGPDLAPNTRQGEDPCLLWLAPDRALWVALAPGAAPPEAAFRSDVTDGLALFELFGPRGADLVAMSCPLAPESAALAAGRCAQTTFAGVKIVLYRVPDGFRLHAEASLAPYLLEWLTQALSALA